MLGGQVALGDADEARQPRLGGEEIVEAGVQRAVAAAIADGKHLAVLVEEEAELHRQRRRFRQVFERLQAMAQKLRRRHGLRQDREERDRVVAVLRLRHQLFEVAAMCGDIGAQGLGAGEDLAIDRARAVGQRICGARQIGQAVRDAGLRERQVREQGRDGVDLCRELRHARSLAQQEEIVLDALRPARVQRRPGRDLGTGIAERDQVACQIAAVHGRDVFRLQRAQILGAVPVVEMAAEALQPVHRGEGRLELLDGGKRAAPSEIARGDDGKQIEADIGGRGAARDDRGRALLEIVGGRKLSSAVTKRSKKLQSAAR